MHSAGYGGKSKFGVRFRERAKCSDECLALVRECVGIISGDQAYFDQEISSSIGEHDGETAISSHSFRWRNHMYETN